MTVTVKRALDILIALPLVLVSAPVVALLALAVRLESRGEPIYRQTRVGQDAGLFEIYKLRTMVDGAEFTGAGLAIAAGDARIRGWARCCGAPRSTSSPTCGMCCAETCRSWGPARHSRARWTSTPDRERGRLAVKPGITGWAQINGRASLPWPERIELDCGTSSTSRWRWTCASSRGRSARFLRGHGIYKGATGGWQPPPQT